MPNYAIIDVGSNTVRLVVYAVQNDAKAQYVRSDFSTVVNDKVMAGLAAFVEDGAFTEAGIRRACSAIAGHLKHAAYFNCKRINVFATAVVRNASNCSEVVSAIQDRLGVPIDVVSGPDEARLGFQGAKSEVAIDNGTMIDIGGGSTELTAVRNGEAGACTSMPLGSLSLYTQLVKFIVPTAREIESISSAYANELALAGEGEFRCDTLFGVGGSVRAAAKMLASMDAQGTRPKALDEESIERILNLCRQNPSAYAHTALRAAPERAHTLAPGCAILSQTMRTLGASRVIVCRCGIREGYLIERVLESTVGTPAST